MNRTKLYYILVITLLAFLSCKKENESTPREDGFVSAVDISTYPEIMNEDPIFFDLKGNKANFLDILKNNGVNTIRLRLWVNPKNEHSGLDEVKEFAELLKAKDFKIWLTLHYSDTWADPSQQIPPEAWQGISYTSIKDSVYVYTKRVMQDIKPEYIQIGNEINTGLLHPYGHINSNKQQFKELISAGIAAVRESSSAAKIILHYAGIENAIWFFEDVNSTDYDIIGLSYYPIWHGKSMDKLKEQVNTLANKYQKKVLIAETAYPFTLDWNDWTNNIVGSEDQLILPNYPASAEGQQKFIRDIKFLIKDIDEGIGFCYWGAELIGWKGESATDGSPWENQALFDFDNKALPVIGEFRIE